MKLSIKLLVMFSLLAPCIGLAVDEGDNTVVTFNDLFRASEIQSIELSPTGEFDAYRRNQQVYVGNSDVGYVRIHNFNEDERVQDIQWIGDNTLVVQTWNRISGVEKFRPSRMGINDDGKYSEIQSEQHSIEGYIHDPLLDSADEVVYARIRREDEYVATDLFRIDVFAKSSKLFKRQLRVDTGSSDYFYYAADSSGNYIAGIRYIDGIPEVWRRSAGVDDWTQIWAANKEADFHPYSISPDGNTLFALSNAFSDKTAAIELDLRDGSLVRTIYEHERFDLRKLLIRPGELAPYGVVFSEQGMLRYHFFSDDAGKEFHQIQSKFPDKGIIIVGRSKDGNIQLVRTSTSKDRGEIQRCDLAGDHCEMLVELAPWLDPETLSDTVVLEIDSEEGITVDAFLTLPIGGGDAIPLVVMPHGGPIGVSDSRYFSQDVQWLAQKGYAVLQVNYRGSSGYGQEFVEAGLREWGRGIEDDIDAAVMSALDEYPQLDGSRIGIFGSSYGGYSALMSVIRNPEMYKCGASFAGVTDLTLLFAQSRLHKNPELRETLARIIGDPDLDYEEQREHSPAYRYKDIHRPILLAHGTADRVVDVEHSWRLRMLMKLRGVDPEFVILDDVGHGFEYIKEAKQLYDPLVAFLDSHLKP